MNSNEDLYEFKPDKNNFTVVGEENIWGHRFYDEQTPEMILLEFFNIFLSKQCHKTLNEENKGVSFEYEPIFNMRLRELVFNNPYLDLVNAKKDLSNEDKWKTWSKQFIENALYFEQKDFDKLKGQFNSQDGFNDFVSIINLIRVSSFEVSSNKRWTSKYIFPYGKDAIYEDVNLKFQKSKEPRIDLDRRFFARTGEILYLMLARSNSAQELAQELDHKFFESSKHNPLNNLVRSLQGGDDKSFDKSKNPKIGFLPDKSHTIFDNLAQDWMAILRLKIPANDAFFYLSQITSLYLARYILDKAQKYIEEHSATQYKENTDMICEVISTNASKIRKLATERFIFNNNLSYKALDLYIKNVKNEKEWQEFEKEEPLKAKDKKIEYLNKYFSYKKGNKSANYTNPDDLLEEIKKESFKKHKGHVGLVHQEYLKNIGLVSVVGSRFNCYVISDSILKALVITLVKGREPVSDFLEKLKDRFKIIIGQNQAKAYLEEGLCDKDAFKQNLISLENRLMSLGLLCKLSDSYNYVINPFYNYIKAEDK